MSLDQQHDQERPITPAADAADVVADGTLFSESSQTYIVSPESGDSEIRRVRTRRRRQLLFAIPVALGVAALMFWGAHWVLQPTKPAQPHVSNATNGPADTSVARDISQSLLTIHTRLRVLSPTELHQLTVSGLTTLQGNTVIAGTLSVNGLRVDGTSTFSGDAAILGSVQARNFEGNLNGAVTGTFRGTATGTFLGISSGTFNGTATGIFSGNGSGLTGITATSCSDCVRLQAGSTAAQPGNVAIAGTLTAEYISAVARIVSRNLAISAGAGDTNVFSVQDSSGASILSANVADRHVSVLSLTPLVAGGIQVRQYTPGHWRQNYTTTTIDDQHDAGVNTNDMVLGADGFGRITYDITDTNGDRSLQYARCHDAECTTKTITTVVTVPSSVTFAAGYAQMKLGSDGFARIVYNADDGLHYLRCLDETCAAHHDSLADGRGASYAGAYGTALLLYPGDTAGIAYTTWLGNDFETYYALCNDQDCSAPSIQYIDTNKWGYEVVDAAIGSDGYARLVYEDASPGDLKLARCTSLACSSPVISVVKAYQNDNVFPGTQGSSVRFAANGMPRIVYQDDANNSGGGGTIVYLECTNQDCTQSVSHTLTTDAYYGWQGLEFELSPTGQPQILHLNNSDSKLHLLQCSDEHCTTVTDPELDTATGSGDSGLSLQYGSDGLARIVFGNDDSALAVKFLKFSQPEALTYIGAVPGNLDVTDGSAIGSSGARFGQIYAQGLDLQGSGLSTALRIDKTVLAEDIGADMFLSLSTNGQEQASIDSAGRFTIGGAASGSPTSASLNLTASNYQSRDLLQARNSTGGVVYTLAADGSTNTAGTGTFQSRVVVGVTTANLQPSAARLSLVAGSGQSQDLLQGLDSTGNTIVGIRSDGSLYVPAPSGNCDGCLNANPMGGLTMLNANYLTNMTVQGGYVYVTYEHRSGINSATASALQVYDISVPTAPKPVSSYALGYGAMGSFTISGSYGYLLVNYPVQSVLIYSLADPAHPALIGSQTVVGTSTTRAIEVAGNYMYVVSGTGLHIYDVTTPATPVLRSYLQLDSYPNVFSLKLIGTTAFVQFYPGTLYSVDVSNPSSPVLLQTISVSTANGMPFTDNMVAIGNKLYIPCLVDACGQDMMVVDVSDPANMQFVPAPNAPMYPPGGRALLKQSGSYLYKLTSPGGYPRIPSTISVYSISNSGQPTFTRSIDVDYIDSFTLVGSYLYTGSSDGNILTILGGPSATLQGLTTTGLQVNGSARVASRLQVAGGIEVSNSDIIVNSINTPTMAINGSAPSYGSLSGSPTSTYYYMLTAIGADGAESLPSNELTVTRSNMRTIIPDQSPLSASAAGAGSLTGTYRYAYTFVTQYGESTTSPVSGSVAVVGQKIDVVIPNPRNRNYTPGMSINLYRCTMPACASYNLVGSGTIPQTDDITISDNTVSAGAAIPATSTSWTDTQIMFFDGVAVPGAVSYRLYRSTTSGSGYTYQTVVPPNLSFMADWGDIGTPGNPPTTRQTGRFGVGTIAPEADLHVAGTGLFRTQIDTVSGFQIQSSSSLVLFVADTKNGRIGIGTATPQASLEVDGTAIFHSTANSTAALKVERSSSQSIFLVDTTNSRVGIGLAVTPLALLHVSGSTAGETLFRVTDSTATARDVFDIADTGVITFRNQTDSASAWRVQNAAGTAIITINTTSLRVEIASGSDLKFAGSGNVRNAITKDFTCTATEAVNDIVIISGSATVGRTTTANSNRVAGIVVAKPTTTTCSVAFAGEVQVGFGSNATPTVIGDPVTTSAVSGMAQSTQTPVAGAVVGKSTSSKDGSNLVWVLLAGN